MKLCFFRAIPVIAAWAIGTPLIGNAQTESAEAADSVPPEAQAAFDRGLHAVQMGDWSLALRYFAEGRKVAPNSPAIALNLGIAYAKAGYDQLAIAWLHAYLAANPQSSRAAAVRQEIGRLTAEAKKKLETLFETAIAAENQTNTDHASAIYWIARGQAEAGLLDDALSTMGSLAGSKDQYFRDRSAKEGTAEVLMAFANTMAEAGDPQRAAEALSRIAATGCNLAELIGYDSSWEAISSKFVQLKDFDRAWRAAKQIPGIEERGKQM